MYWTLRDVDVFTAPALKEWRIALVSGRHARPKLRACHRAGNQHLDKQITAVTTTLRIADDKQQFKALFRKAYPSKAIEGRKPLVVDVSKVKPSKEANLFADLEEPDSQ